MLGILGMLFGKAIFFGGMSIATTTLKEEEQKQTPTFGTKINFDNKDFRLKK